MIGAMQRIGHMIVVGHPTNLDESESDLSRCNNDFLLEHHLSYEAWKSHTCNQHGSQNQ